MGTIVTQGLGAGILATMALAPQEAQARFYGLSSGEVSSFTSTSDGCAISLLFDDFRAPPDRPTKVPGTPKRSFTIVTSPDSRARRMNLDFRGAQLNSVGAMIQVKIGGQQFNLLPKSENYSIRATARTTGSGAATLVEVALVAPAGAKPGDSLLNIDTIDASLPVCSPPAGKHQP